MCVFSGANIKGASETNKSGVIVDEAGSTEAKEPQEAVLKPPESKALEVTS